MRCGPILTLIVVFANAAEGAPNIGGRWLGANGGPQGSKYIPLRLGHPTGAQYNAPVYGFGYGPGHSAALDDATAWTPNYGKLTRWNMSAATNSTPLHSLNFPGQSQMGQLQLIPTCGGDAATTKTLRGGNNGAAVYATLVGWQAYPTNPSPNMTLFGVFAGTERNVGNASMAIRWALPLGNATSVLTTAGQCAVYVATCSLAGDCFLATVDVTTGTVLRNATLPTPGGGAAATVEALSVSDDGRLLFVKSRFPATNQATIAALWAPTGATLWRRTFAEQGTFQIALAYSHRTAALVTTLDDGQFYVLEAFTGVVRWSMPFSTGDAAMSPAVDDGAVYLPINQTTVTRLSIHDGSVLTRYGPGNYENDLLVFEDALVVMQSQAGSVQVQVNDKWTGHLLTTVPTPAGYWNKNLGFASGWLWAWSGAEGAAPVMIQFA